METTRSSGVLRVLREALGKRANASEEEGAESGFTLIELMVVLLIMAILLAIAIPTFLGVQGGAQDRAAQSNLTTAFTSAKAFYANNGSTYSPAAPATGLLSALISQEPELTFTTGSASNANLNLISVAIGSNGNTLVLADQSKNAYTCWWLASAISSTNTFSVPLGTSYAATVGTSSGCKAGTLSGGSGWQPSYPAGP
ncbi:MAG: type IV pilin protein [Acidimicrobiales bacterium]